MGAIHLFSGRTWRSLPGSFFRSREKGDISARRSIKSFMYPPGNFRSRQNTTRVEGLQFIGALLAVGTQPIATMHEVLHASLMLQDQMPDIVELEDSNLI
jgi:hypothetical protein